MSATAAALRATFADWGDVPRIVGAIFGTEDPAAIAATLDSYVAERLGARIGGVEFASASVGLVFGLRLHDARRAVVKVHRPETSMQFLEAMQVVQRFVAAGGFPCPVPLLEPGPLGTGVAVAESALPASDRANAHLARVRRTMAAALSDLVQLCRQVDPPPGLRDRPLQRLPGELWPPPHDLRFDFDATVAGAEWIDELAARAAAQRDSMPGAEPVIGHSDWSAQNVRFRREAVAAVYDWDSVALEQEPILVGSAAHAFSADWTVPRRRQLPNVRESLAFVADYEATRGASFDDAERRVALGALVYSRAYAARCAHSDVLTNFGRHAPSESLADDMPGNTARSSLPAYERLLSG